MLQLDPDDPDDDENAPKMLIALANSTNTDAQGNSGASSSILTETDQIVLDNYKVPANKNVSYLNQNVSF